MKNEDFFDDISSEEIMIDLMDSISLCCLKYLQNNEYRESDAIISVILSLETVLASFLYEYCKGDGKTYDGHIKQANKTLRNIFKRFKEDFPDYAK
jgi:hypothetical protein